MMYLMQSNFGTKCILCLSMILTCYKTLIQIIYISWNRNIKRRIIIFNYTKFWFYVQIKHLIEDHCTDQAQKAETVLPTVILLINVSLCYNSLISFNSASPLM